MSSRVWWEAETNKAPINGYHRYDIKQSDSEAPIRQSTPSLPSLPNPIWPGVVAPDRVQSMGQIKPFHSFSYFLVLRSLYQSFGVCTKSSDYNWYNRHSHVPQFFQFPCKVQVHILLCTLLQFYSEVSRSSKVHDWPRLDCPSVAQNPREFYASHFLGRVLGCAYTICSYSQIAQFPVDHLSHPVVSSLILLHSLIIWLVVSYT